MTVSPFRLVQFHVIRMPTGRRVRDAGELLEAIQQMSDSILSRHLSLCALDLDFDPARSRNDFARWATDALGEPALGEALSVIEPYRRHGWETIRQQIEEILEDPRWSHGAVRARHDLYLEDATEVCVQTDVCAHDLDELHALVEGADLGSIFHHVHGAAARHPADHDDFSCWIETELGHRDIAARLRAIDFPFYTLEELKRELLTTLDVERRRVAETVT